MIDNHQQGTSDIILLGTGGGYGESLLVHFGDGNWMIVDSCIDPTNNKCIPLQYLKKNNIDPESIKIIVCTHWHDDHIKGLHEILDYCSDAEFAFAKASDFDKFSLVLKIDSKRPSSRSTSQLKKCLEILDSRNQSVKMCYPDRLLYKNGDFEVISLSPCDESLLQFDQYLTSVLADLKGLNKDIQVESPNHYSTVLQVKFGFHTALLGADLEVTLDHKTGWFGIIKSSTSVATAPKSKYFKIAHHGSENGYDSSVWDFLFDDPEINCSMTPWVKGGNYIPKDLMIDTFKRRSKSLYITSTNRPSKKPKKRDRLDDRAIKQFANNISEIKFNLGLIRSSIDFSDSQATWTTTTKGTSIKLK